MKKIFGILLKPLRLASLAAALCTLNACNAIYDYEGDCEATYTLKFTYDRNLKWANAFANEVQSVRLYAFDQNGTLRKEWNDAGDNLANPDYAINLGLPAGKYRLVAWCGIDNPEVQKQHFAVAQTQTDHSALDELNCRINRQYDNYNTAFSDNRLEFLFHGAMDVELPEDNDGGDYSYTMSLTKNTNHIRIILQQLSGEATDANQFDFAIEDNNGLYNHDNSLLDDERLTYRAYATFNGSAGLGKEENTRALVYVNGAIADLSTGRLMAENKKSTYLTIHNPRGEEIASVPIIQYILLSKAYYEEAYRHKMDEQEFLDREDEFVLTFFLDENQHWISTSILIHSWRIVLQDADIS